MVESKFYLFIVWFLDRIFDKDMATIDLYVDFAKSIVLSVMEGINGENLLRV